MSSARRVETPSARSDPGARVRLGRFFRFAWSPVTSSTNTSMTPWPQAQSAIPPIRIRGRRWCIH